jgi:tetratricopeptide (TPR) repeat protein
LGEGSERAFRRALDHDQAGRLAEAEREYREALREDPAFLAARNNLGNVLQRGGRHAEAEACYRAVLEREPEAVEPLFNLGRSLRALGRAGEAAECDARVLSLLAAAGDGLAREGRPAEALDLYQHALELRPGDPVLLNQAGVMLAALGRHEEALGPLRRALDALPEDADTAFNLGVVLHALGRTGDAVDLYDRVLRADPGRGEAALGKALALLVAGDYARGWPAYECRYSPRFQKPRVARPAFAFPMWQGEPLAGKRILLLGEQGYGDQIQFIRYADLLARQGATVDVAVEAPLRRLFASAPGVAAVRDPAAGGASGHDYWSLLLSLPLRFGTTLDSVPAPIPYLRAPDAERRKWAERLRCLPAGKPRVGLAWTTGVASREILHGRSMGLEPLRPLAAAGNVEFVGVQFGESGDAGFPMLRLGGEVGDFADQAGLLANLDLLVTVDTAVGHLAGALGLPAWILMPAIPDWRWMRDREDSPWYPGMRLLRQSTLGDWRPVVDRVVRDLRALPPRPA